VPDFVDVFSVATTTDVDTPSNVGTFNPAQASRSDGTNNPGGDLIFEVNNVNGFGFQDSTGNNLVSNVGFSRPDRSNIYSAPNNVTTGTFEIGRVGHPPGDRGDLSGHLRLDLHAGTTEAAGTFPPDPATPVTRSYNTIVDTGNPNIGVFVIPGAPTIDSVIGSTGARNPIVCCRTIRT